MYGSRKHRMPSGMHIKRAENGGYIVRHDYDNREAGESYQPPTEHVFAKHGDLMKHVKMCYGGEPPEAPSQRPAPTKAAGAAAARKRGAGVD